MLDKILLASDQLDSKAEAYFVTKLHVEELVVAPVSDTMKSYRQLHTFIHVLDRLGPASKAAT